MATCGSEGNPIAILGYLQKCLTGETVLNRCQLFLCFLSLFLFSAFLLLTIRARVIALGADSGKDGFLPRLLTGENFQSIPEGTFSSSSFETWRYELSIKEKYSFQFLA